MTYLVRCFRIAAILVPTLATAQKPLVLSKPDAEYPEPFSQLTSVRELKDGRVLISDTREKLLQIINFSGGATNVGREGSGPGEFAIPWRIVALPADSSAVYDRGTASYLLVHPDGKPGRDFRLEVRGSGQGGGLSVRPAPRGVDARGNIYYEGSGFHVNAAGALTPSDSAPVIRFDRAALRADTVAFTRLAKGHGSVTPTADGGIQILNGVANPLVPRDDWVVLPDGRVAVVRADTYHIDFYTSRTARTSGAPVPYEKIKVDGAVRQMVEEQRVRAWRNASTMATGRGGAPSRNIPRPPSPPALTGWPDVMPPFQAQAAVARPNGQVWVLRTQKPGNDAPLYDVFDRAGRVIGHVLLPPRTTLLGFGQGTVYLVRSDDDDLQYLQRYRLPIAAKLSG